MKHLKIAYFIKVLYILHISVTVAEVLDTKAFLFTSCGIFFLHSFSLIVNGEERMEQERELFFEMQLILFENPQFVVIGSLSRFIMKDTLPDSISDWRWNS